MAKTQYILGLEASRFETSVALWRTDAESHVSRSSKDGATESALRLINTLVTGAGISIADVGTLVVSSGPGSYTGIRTALSIVAGLKAKYSQLHTLAPSIFDAAACSYLSKESSQQAVQIWSEAREGEVFIGGYAATWEGEKLSSLERLGEVSAVPTSTLDDGEGAHARLAVHEVLDILELQTPADLLSDFGKLRTENPEFASWVRADALIPTYVKGVNAKTLAERGIVLGSVNPD